MADINELVLRLGDPDPTVRAGAAGALGSAALRGADISAAVPALADLLSDQETDVIGKSAEALRRMSLTGADFLGELVLRLGDPDPEARADAASALKRIALIGVDISAAVPALAQALSDEDASVREKSAETLRDAARGERHSQATRTVVPALSKAVSDPNPAVKYDAIAALGEIAQHGTGISPAIPALMGVLSGADVTLRMHAAGTLGYAAMHGTDVSDATPLLVKMLSGGKSTALGNLAWALGKAAVYEKSRDVALCALAKTLFEGGLGLRVTAAEGLEHAASKGTDMGVAISALAKALPDGNAGIRKNAAMAFGHAVRNCASIEALDAMGFRLQEEYGAFRRKRGYMPESAGIGFTFSRLINEAAKRRDELTATRDILLDERPKPPKGGTIFQATRRALANV
jgi:HEAT repeat protein